MGVKLTATARERALAFLERVGRPVTGGEVQTYALTNLSAREVRQIMAGLEAEGRVSAWSARPCGAAVGRVSWTYRIVEKG